MSRDKKPAINQNLTHQANVAIIPPLFNAEVQEIKLARKVIWQQALVTLAATGAAYGWESTHQYAIPVLVGGGVSVLNGAMLAWRMNRAMLLQTHDAHQQLRLLYFYAAERFLAVIAMLAICLIVLRLSPIAVLIGFALGQAVLLIARLFFKLKFKNSD